LRGRASAFDYGDGARQRATMTLTQLGNQFSR